MGQFQTVQLGQEKTVSVSKARKILAAIIFLTVFQGIILFGPQFLGTWAHDNFHSYRHSVGMPCH